MACAAVDALQFVWRLAQTPYNLNLYGPAAARFGNVALGVPGNLFSHGLRRSSSQRAGKRRRLARSMPDGKTLG